MSDQTTPHRRHPAATDRQRPLSDNVRHRVAAGPFRSASGKPLLLASVPGPVGERAQAYDAAATVQAQRDEGQAQSAAEEERPQEAGEASRSRPNVQQIADRVYQLFCEDLRIEQERTGW